MSHYFLDTQYILYQKKCTIYTVGCNGIFMLINEECMHVWKVMLGIWGKFVNCWTCCVSNAVAYQGDGIRIQKIKRS